jgi:hypothetical protein
MDLGYESYSNIAQLVGAVKTPVQMLCKCSKRASGQELVEAGHLTVENAIGRATIRECPCQSITITR